MDYQLGIKENAIDSFNEALAKFERGEKGELRQYKFAILHLSHFLELVLKLYIVSIDKDLVYSRCFREVEKKAKKESIDLHAAFSLLQTEGFDFEALINAVPSPHTITLDQALEFAKCEKCKITGVDFVDVDFCRDIEWLKGLRNNIEHYQFALPPKDVRLCIGRLVRGVSEFVDVFGLFDLKEEVGSESYHVFEVLADEYAHLLREAEREVEERREEVFRGVRPKHYVFTEWNVYQCPECANKTLISDNDSDSGYKCTFCGNTESDEIEVPCDCCGAQAPLGEMATWWLDDKTSEYRCYFCSGEYYADKDD